MNPTNADVMQLQQKMARLASLTADAGAPTELSSEQKAKLDIHPKVIKLGQRNKALKSLEISFPRSSFRSPSPRFYVAEWT